MVFLFIFITSSLLVVVQVKLSLIIRIIIVIFVATLIPISYHNRDDFLIWFNHLKHTFEMILHNFKSIKLA